MVAAQLRQEGEEEEVRGPRATGTAEGLGRMRAKEMMQGPCREGVGKRTDAQHFVSSSKSQGVRLVQSAGAKILQWTFAVTRSPCLGSRCRQLPFSLTKL